jgi:hypothetical protein
VRLQLAQPARLALAVAITFAMRDPVSAADEPWRLSTDTLVYSDSDNVVVVSPQVAVRRALDDDGGNASARVVVDVVSAASVDVVSQATNRFSEVRTEADLGLAKSFGSWLPSVSYRYSHEPDYHSTGLGAGLQHRFAGSDATASVSYDLSLDTVGYVGTGEGTFSEPLVSHAANFSLTQVIGPKALVRGVYTLSVQDGYLEKPYRFVPIFDRAGIAAAASDGVAINLSNFDRYRLPERITEEVPDTRIGHAFAVRGLRHVEAISGSIHADVQLFADSWGLTAETIEPGLTWSASQAILMAIYLRGYFQQAARFWRREYVVDDPDTVPRWRTLDRDLSDYFAATLGGRFEWQRGILSGYVDLSGAVTAYSEYLFLNGRLALIGQAGLRLDL